MFYLTPAMEWVYMEQGNAPGMSLTIHRAQ